MTNESRLSGELLRRLAERLYDRQTLERVVLPAIADLQHECVGGAPTSVRMRAYWGVWKTLAICTLLCTYRQARPTIASVTRRTAVILPLIMGALLLPALDTGSAGKVPVNAVLVTSMPQAFAAALLVAYYFAVALEQWPTSPRRLLPAICATSAICTLIMLIMTMVVVPRANQVFRESVAEKLRVESTMTKPTLGPAEWSLTELIGRTRGSSADREAAWQQISARLVASTLPIMIGFVALGISGFPPRIAVFSGVWVLMLYFVVLRSAAPSSYRPPTVESVWLVNAVFTVAGLWLIWLRPRPDDSGSASRMPMP
jgi:hypothetical protein